MKQPMYIKTIVICIVLFVSVCKVTTAQQKKGLLWEITGKDMKEPAYLFGTVHLYDTTLYGLPQLPAGLLNKVSKVYFEMDFANVDQAELMAGVIIKDTTQYLDKILDSTSLRSLHKLAAASPMLKGMGNKIYKIKPLILMSWVAASYTNATTVDFELYRNALAQKKPIGGLETTKEQMAAINAVPIVKQADMLKKSLDESCSLEQQVKKLTEVYTKQELDNLMTVLNDNMPVDPSFDDAIRANRNVTMTNKIDSILRTEHPLVVVGAGHFGNHTGLIALLQQKGYTLKNVPVIIKKAHE